MNPFNKIPITAEELRSDCLCYLQFRGEPVKASRLHAGLEHEQQVKRIADHFNQDTSKYKDMEFTPELVYRRKSDAQPDGKLSDGFTFRKRSLAYFRTDIEAYYQLISDLVDQQFLSTSLVVGSCGVEAIFVDGGFSNNSIFMHLLANRFSGLEVFAASLPQATALGAALSIHGVWNSKLMPKDMIGLTHYPTGQSASK
ncbi:MAG TPA: carbohydrate kinase, partial [Puia sp.]